jgi:heme A synthase
MTPERVAELVAWWVRFYTRDLPVPTAQRRVDEIAADVQDHIAHERTHGTSDRRLALSILSRVARGTAADAAWRRQVRARRGIPMKSLLLILVTAIFAGVIGAAAVVYGEGDDSPGLQLIGVLFLVGAVVVGVRTALRSR